MNQLIRFLFLTFLALLGPSCEESVPNINEEMENAQHLADSLRQIIAPDKRVFVFTPSIKQPANGDCFQLAGYSQSSSAAAELKALLSESGYCIYDSLLLLPAPELGEDTLGIVKVSVANLRSAPGHSSELATQALLGMPLNVLEQRGSWWRVQTPDGYIAWLDGGAFQRLDRSTMEAYYRGELAMVNIALVQLTEGRGGGSVIRDLSLGNVVKVGPTRDDYRSVTLPDGQMGYLASDLLMPLSDWSARSAALQLPELAKHFYGAPYLWGGTSTKGMDCSGFTKMTYWINGFVIPRDASQQVHAGIEVPLDEELSQLRVGDLLFFGNLREDGSQRITHVGLYLGGGRFVHSGADNGYIREQSLLPDTPDYADHRRESLLRAKRLSIGSPGVRPALTLFGDQQEKLNDK